VSCGAVIVFRRAIFHPQRNRKASVADNSPGANARRFADRFLSFRYASVTRLVFQLNVNCPVNLRILWDQPCRAIHLGLVYRADCRLTRCLGIKCSECRRMQRSDKDQNIRTHPKNLVINQETHTRNAAPPTGFSVIVALHCWYEVSPRNNQRV